MGRGDLRNVCGAVEWMMKTDNKKTKNRMSSHKIMKLIIDDDVIKEII